jgi:hypothetical protein
MATATDSVLLCRWLSHTLRRAGDYFLRGRALACPCQRRQQLTYDLEGQSLLSVVDEGLGGCVILC